MLVSKDVINHIDEIIERSYLRFTHMLLGEDILSDEDKIRAEAMGLIIGQKPLIELLYTLVRQRSTERYQTDQTLNELLLGIMSLGILPAMTDNEKATINNAKQQFLNNIDNAKQILKNDVKKEIIKTNNDYRNMSVINGFSEALHKEPEFNNKLLTGIGLALLASQSAFTKDFISGLTDFVNNTVVDEIKSKMGNKVGDIEVYKITTKDSSLCQWCSGFYDDENGKPVIYKLSELQRNGSNQGKPKSAWRPTIGATHPHCRCSLVYKDAK